MNNPNALEYLKTIKPLIWSKILNYLPKKEPFDHYEMVKDYPYRQGKYFRPGLVMLSTEMYGAKKEDALLSAAAVQLSEDWLLIHDDIEDQSEMRRGKPTLNVLHGNELAINAGDALHVIMWKILGENILALGLNYGIKIYNIFNDVLLTTTEGQAIDLTWIHDNKIDITEKEYLDMVKRKTCYYTIIGPVQIGAMIAGQSKDELKKIEEWGLPFGYAFQIWDDCMNLTSQEQGKELAGDILEGKRTLILSHLLLNCNSLEKTSVLKIYSKDRLNKTEKEKQSVLNLMIKYKSIEYAQRKAQAYSEKALKLFKKYTTKVKNKSAKKNIEELMRFVVNREK